MVRSLNERPAKNHRGMRTWLPPVIFIQRFWAKLALWAYFRLGANLPFDKLRANGQASSFALNLPFDKLRANGQAFSFALNLPFDKLRANGQAFSFALNLPFDKLRANGQAFSFALSLSKGSFPPS
jgi:hypothetical protein